MSRGPQAFRQRDLTKAVRAVLAAGIVVDAVRVEKDGAIVVITGRPGENKKPKNGALNEWDRIL